MILMTQRVPAAVALARARAALNGCSAANITTRAAAAGLRHGDSDTELGSFPGGEPEARAPGRRLGAGRIPAVIAWAAGPGPGGASGPVA
jgi:hypothetical protein